MRRRIYRLLADAGTHRRLCLKFKRMTHRFLLVTVLSLGGLPAATRAQKRCDASPLMLQVLGSGGPFASGNRASSGYLVWRDGKPIVMVDAGGGTYLRFAEAGARLA